MFENKSSATIINRKQEIRQPWRTPLDTEKLFDIVGYKITELVMSL